MGSARAVAKGRHLRARHAQLIAAAAALILCMLTARDLTLGGLLLPKEVLISAAGILSLLSCLLFTDLRGLWLSEAAALGAALPVCIILLGGAASVPLLFLVCLTLCMLCYFGLRLLCHAACRGKLTPALRRRCHRLARAWTLPFIGAAVVLIALTSAVSTGGGEVLLERAPLDREELFALYEEELSAMESRLWLSYSEEERVAALEAVVELECRWLGIEPPALISAELGEDVLGQYDNKQSTVFISSEELRSEAAFTCISTLLHELRHCYQFRVVESIDWEKGSSALRYYSEAVVWRDELMSYVSGTHDAFEEYYGQAIEIDAREYARVHALDYVEILS